MTKTLATLAVAASVAVAAVAAPAPAEARSRGGAVAAGVIGGLALGAIAGSALAAPRYYYAPGPYAPGPAYYPAYDYGPACTWRRERFWDGYGWVVRRVRVCY